MTFMPIKWTIQRQQKNVDHTWTDCQNGHRSVLGYKAHQEELLMEDLQRLRDTYPANEYRVIQHVDFTPAVPAKLTPR